MALAPLKLIQRTNHLNPKESNHPLANLFDENVEILPMKRTKVVLQSLESDADAEMSASTSDESDILEYNASESLDDPPENLQDSEKAISGSLGEIQSIRKLRSGDLLVEVKSRKQSQQILKLKTLGTIPVSVTAHTSLNTCKGVITCGELLNETVEKITEELNSEGVIHVRRISIRRDGQLLPTKHLILTFHKPKLPESIRAGYIKLAVRPYIPNPLRCFQCQRFGHAKGACRGTITCAHCAEIGHDSQQCTAQEKCVNCSGSHTSYSRSCPRWQAEKQIVTVKFKENLSYPEARRKVTAQTPIPGVSYASALTDTSTKAANKIKTPENPSETDTILSEPTPTKQSKPPRKNKRKPKSQSSNPKAFETRTAAERTAFKIKEVSPSKLCCFGAGESGQEELNNLVVQLPTPFILLGDFNGHSTLLGSDSINSRGQQIEQFISDNCLCLLNNDETTYFHEPTRTFHSLDLAICSPELLPLLNFSVGSDLYNSDNFPLIVSHADSGGATLCLPRFLFQRADWTVFSQLADITENMVRTADISEAVQHIINAITNAANNSIPKTSPRRRKFRKPWWNAACRDSCRREKILWNRFRRCPTTENLVAFKQAKALARRIRRRSQRESRINFVASITSSTSSKQLWKKVKAANGIYREFSFPILNTGNVTHSAPLDIANTLGYAFAQVSANDSYSPDFMAIKNRAERTHLRFTTRRPFPL
ncbi:hypothetical protein AVEN_7606-1 [Araneus ventricosus]|uniref:Endonuclease/exonuclease/phosphatase domain-containing protein n=1 Tax=Araneus ventricosus TaxID=182803 RepID=A0A4Y2N0Z2_ARAVE|nr:hypothetical protein AVEN_7606-1 [Araneus ventricosus]